MYAYPAKLTKDGNALVVTFPDVPEAITYGPDRANAIKQGTEALTLALSFYVEDGKPLPTPSEPKRGQVVIEVSGGTVAKLALYEEMRAQGVTQTELGRRLGCKRQKVARMVDPAYNTKIEVLEAALATLGLRVSVTVLRSTAITR